MSSQLLSNFKLFSSSSNNGPSAPSVFEPIYANYKWIVVLVLLGITSVFYIKREDTKLALDQWSTAANSFLVKWWISASAGEWSTTYVPSDFFSK
jgi:hypothetical protein